MSPQSTNSDSTREIIEGSFDVVKEHLALTTEDDGLGSSSTNTDESESEFLPTAFGAPGLMPIILPEGCTRAEAISHLSKDIPNNEYGFPVYYYRSDLLPGDLETLSQDDLDTAAQRLDYSEGYPTFNDGVPWWEQLPHEPLQYYQAFQRFVEQPETIGIRQLSVLAKDNHLSLQEISQWAKEFYWSARARVHDAFITAADKKRREFRQRRIENDHFSLSDRLLKQVQHFFDEEGWVAKLDGKDAVDILERLIKLQRLSSGLSTNGNAQYHENPTEGMTVAAVMREITKSSSLDGDSGQMTDEMQRLMLGDSDFLERAQAMVIEVRRGDLSAQLSKSTTTDSHKVLGE